MKKLISLIIFVGLAINVSAQDQPTNREEAMAKVSWLIGDWERTSSNGEKQQSSYKWAIENIAILITTGGRMQSSGVLGFDRINGKLVGKSFNRIGTADSEWSFSDGKLIEKITLKEKNRDGEPFEFKFPRSYRSVDKNTLETAIHRFDVHGDVGDVVERDGTKLMQ